jgi:VWFA-related protein
MTRTTTLAVVIACLAALSLGASRTSYPAPRFLAAETAAAQTKFRTRVESVRLDALVLAGGQPVMGLTAADFEVRDNGALQTVTILGAGSLPLDVILALDLSSSLTGTRLAALRAASASLLDALEPEDRAALATFSHAVTRRQALTPDVGLVQLALEEAKPTGATSLIDAMYAALAMADTGDRRTLLIVFSDGIDTASWLPADAVVSAAKRSETVIYAVSAAGTRQAPQILVDVTEASGGKVLEVDSRGLATAFVKILNEFRQRYVLSYTLANTPSPGWHRIDVRVKPRGATVKARSGYRVGPR